MAARCCAPLPANNIDTGLGLNRMAAILQDKPSVFETDQFAPLIELGESLSGRSYGAEHETDRALRILADHSRAMTFLTADGVVPSNEDRGYVLRRVMRRAIQQGRNLGLEPGFLTRYSAVVRELMGGAYPELSSTPSRPTCGSPPRRRASGAPSRRAWRRCASTSSVPASRGCRSSLRRGGLPPARHLRLPLRDDQRAAGRGGAGHRGRLRQPDGGAAGPRPGRRPRRPRRRRTPPGHARHRGRLRRRERLRDALHRL